MNGRKRGCEGGGGNRKNKVMSQRKDKHILLRRGGIFIGARGKGGGECECAFALFRRVLQVGNFEGFQAFF